METEFEVENQIESQIEDQNEADEKEEISFEDLGLDDVTLAAVQKKGFKVPSPIQVLAIPRLLNGDANIIAKARTGTGKTAAFGLPIVQTIRGKGAECVRALVLEPTRELAMQTCAELQSFGDGNFPRVAVLYGGASYSTQIKELKRGVEIVVGTPGRIKDHLERGTLKLDNIDYFILDEGDEMLDMGFVDDIESIFAKANPQSRILLFSATMPKPILKIAETFMGEYDICEEEGFVEEPLLIDQKYWVVKESEKIEALVRVIDMADDFYGLVFTQTKNDADTVTRLLDERGYEVAALHGDIPQAQREKILARFRSKKTRVLVATDVAARGIDISGLSHVVNYSLPFDGATYIHRIGRTGRAGTSGVAITFVRPEEARRKLEYLKSAVRRAAKGEMKEGEIPSVEDVLEAKRNRMLQSLRVQLGLSAENEENAQSQAADTERGSSAGKAPAVYDDDEIIPLEAGAAGNAGSADNAGTAGAEAGAESAASADSAASAQAEAGDVPADNADSAAGVTGEAKGPALKPVDSVYVKMAAELSAGQDPEAVLAGVLSAWYGKTLNASHYGRISRMGRRDGNGRRERSDNAPRADQKRLYVQLGKRDGFFARDIAEYFSSLLHIPGRLVDQIEVTQNFSLVSLPIASADKVLEMARRDSSIPHVHVDSRNEDGAEGGRSGGRSGGRRSGFGGGRRDSFDRDGREGRAGDGGANRRRSFNKSGRFGAGSRFNGEDRGDRSRSFGSGRSYRNEHGRANVHTPTERTGASAYKKASRKEEF
ncbi:MAG: DEAD/DEAH box helicase [Treponema sp.]|nr:DEAD/DEAH box helicase [Treponema sp.]